MTYDCFLFSRNIRFSDGVLVTGKTGPATAQIWFSEVACSQKDQSFLNCTRTDWGTHPGCTHANDVYLRCAKPSSAPAGIVKLNLP